MQRSCVIMMFLNPPGRKALQPEAAPPPSGGEAVSDPSESDLADPPANATSRRGRRSNPIGRSPRDASERAVPTPQSRGRKRQREAAEAVGDAAEASLLSPDKLQKVQGRVNASGIVVSVKDGRVLGKHLELKLMGFTTSYRNPRNTNT